MERTQVLIDTARQDDALACGYETATEAHMGGLRIEFEVHRDIGPTLVVTGMDGEVKLIGEAAIRELIRSANIALSRNAALASQAMKAA